METCTHVGCNKPVSKAGHKLCLDHWKSTQLPKPEVVESEKIHKATSYLSATNIGEKIGLSNQKVNKVLAELGWVSKSKEGWVATPQGISLGAIQKEHAQSGFYVVWPDDILQNNALNATIKSLNGEAEEHAPQEEKNEVGFREKYPPTHRTTDGHWVRSKAETLIDNWLYMSGIAHAYERQLPIAEVAYCDFYIPDGKVYIEYWGIESDPKYQARKKVKLGLYYKYNFNLIELSDEHIKNLDDFLPKMLLKFNVVVS